MKGGNFISKLIKVLAVIIHETDLKFTRFTVFYYSGTQRLYF